MQEWIVAMLVISVLLVLRDMAKVFFRGRSFLKAEQPAEEKNPQKEKVERYAASFRKLADSFYGLPYRKDYLSNGQVDGIIRETCDEICGKSAGAPSRRKCTEEVSGWFVPWRREIRRKYRRQKATG